MKDVVIIGGGPGGYVAAIRGAQLGLDVALVEKSALGGTCLNVGCIPTKTYVAMTEVLKNIHRADMFGIKVGSVALDLPAMVQRKNDVVAKLVSGIEYIFKKRNIAIYRGMGVVKDAHTVVVGSETIEAKHIILATGSEPLIPPMFQVDGFTLDSTAILDLTEVPERLVVVGGGVIGVEFACIWAHLGAKVTIVEMQKNLLPMVDKRLAMRLKSTLKKMNIEVLTEKKVEKVEYGKLTLNDGSELIANKMLVAIGRKPVYHGVDCDKLGIEKDGQCIKVNAHMQTSVPNIYAIGDIVPSAQLAHVASKEGIVAVEHIAGHTAHINYDAIPWAIFTTPEIAVVGKSQDAVENAKVGQFPFAANGKALGMAEDEGYAKIIANADGIVVGMEIFGPHASDMIHEGAIAIEQKMTLEALADIVHAHPTLSEAVVEAAENALGKAIHSV